MKFSRVFAFGFVSLTALTSGISFAAPMPVSDLPACRGVPVADWGASMLTNQVSVVQEIKPETPASEAESVVQRWGARVIVPAQPGMTPEWLQRVAECHTAQVAASDPATLTSSPLDVVGARVSVQSTGDGFAVDITSGDPRIGRQILSRARPLAPLPAPRHR